MEAQAQITLLHQWRALPLPHQPRHRRISTIHPWRVLERDGDDSKRDVGNSTRTDAIHFSSQ